jgi:hypothetical protein
VATGFTVVAAGKGTTGADATKAGGKGAVGAATGSEADGGLAWACGIGVAGGGVGVPAAGATLAAAFVYPGTDTTRILTGITPGPTTPSSFAAA